MGAVVQPHHSFGAAPQCHGAATSQLWLSRGMSPAAQHNPWHSHGAATPQLALHSSHGRAAAQPWDSLITAVTAQAWYSHITAMAQSWSSTSKLWRFSSARPWTAATEPLDSHGITCGLPQHNNRLAQPWLATSTVAILNH